MRCSDDNNKKISVSQIFKFSMSQLFKNFSQSTCIIQVTFSSVFKSFTSCTSSSEIINDQRSFFITINSLMITTFVSLINLNWAIKFLAEFLMTSNIFLTDDTFKTLVSNLLQKKLLQIINSCKKTKRKRVSHKISEVEKNEKKSETDLQRKLNHLIHWNCFLHFTNLLWNEIAKKYYNEEFDIDSDAEQETWMKIFNSVKNFKNKTIDHMKICVSYINVSTKSLSSL